MRDLQGSFTDRQWTGVYKQTYENLAPGGWFEVVDASAACHCDDGTMPEDSLLAQSGFLMNQAADNMGKPADSMIKSRSRLEAAGFTNIHEKLYKVPLGDWTKNPILKEAGRFCKAQLLEGLEGYCMFLYTKFLSPTWAPEEVQVYLAKLRQEINTPDWHGYYMKKRVWAQKPLDKEPKAE